ncbi:MAG: hypothetical protein M1372_01250 [Patescibacteria group bacterium]|nr:hypothetical protein [Patescibacteria group bacterium]
MNLKFKILSFFYLVTIIGLFFYSFTQVDLSLTLSRWSVWQGFEKFFQHIGYFNRPLSAALFITLLILLFVFYISFLLLSGKNKVSGKQIWVLVIVTAVILSFSYNAFSYDLFNYMFDAKIVTYYHQNPYAFRALDFPGDPMLSFMHWTHRFYPYGPVWLILTVPLSFLGFNFFLPTLFLFKFLSSLSYLGIAVFITKILRRISPKDEVFGLVFFALNPLVIIEGLVSAHNEMPMMFLAMFSLFLFLNKKYLRSLALLILSIGVKFATAFMLPVYIFVYFLFRTNKKINVNLVFSLTALLMIIPVVIGSVRTNFQPWYLLSVLPLASLTGKKYYVFIPAITMSFFALLEYAPFLFRGDWNQPGPAILFWLTLTGIIISISITCLKYALGNLVWASRK